MTMRFVRSGVFVWTVAIVVTLALAAFQRMSGPTHPRRGVVTMEGHEIAFRFLRSHGGEGGLPVSLDIGNLNVDGGILQWRLYPGEHPWNDVPMRKSDGALEGEVPHQPPAGKVEYRVLLQGNGAVVQLPGNRPVVARFKGAIPSRILIPHILCMFLGMLLATVALVRVATGGTPPRATVIAGMLFLMAGGLVLGPMVQHHAFGAYWTGWPYGTDLTDNKTAIAFLAWLPATILALRKRPSRVAISVGWLVMMGVFLIPHSLRGSQIDWQKEGVGAARTTAAPAGSPTTSSSGGDAPGASGAQEPPGPAATTDSAG